MPVTTPRDVNPLSLAFVTAGVETGLPLNRDFNGAELDGVGMLYSNVREGERYSLSGVPASGGRAFQPRDQDRSARQPGSVRRHSDARRRVHIRGRGAACAIRFRRALRRGRAQPSAVDAVRRGTC
ncbi:hypothetical protein GTY60_08825 [Streptomyces sp. SID8367]|nr:hypothetical protein [Streptomyces sp. SID8367]